MRLSNKRLIRGCRKRCTGVVLIREERGVMLAQPYIMPCPKCAMKAFGALCGEHQLEFTKAADYRNRFRAYNPKRDQRRAMEPISGRQFTRFRKEQQRLKKARMNAQPVEADYGEG